MAHTIFPKFMDAPEKLIGTHVYKAYEARRPGTIISVFGRSITIKWLDGTISTEDLHGLNDFDHLIADHRKKLATHETALRALEEMQI